MMEDRRERAGGRMSRKLTPQESENFIALSMEIAKAVEPTIKGVLETNAPLWNEDIWTAIGSRAVMIALCGIVGSLLRTTAHVETPKVRKQLLDEWRGMLDRAVRYGEDVRALAQTVH